MAVKEEYELYLELQEKIEQLNKYVKAVRECGIDRAKTEHDYKVLLRQKCLELRSQGMAIGMIDKVCYGIPEVANARLQRDISDAVYQANLEAINSTKLQMRLIEEQIKRDWNQS